MDLYKKLQKVKGLDDIICDPSEKVEFFLNSGSISLNLLNSGKVNGAVPKGMISMMSAPSALGKSLIGLYLIRAAQKRGMICVVIATEKTFNHELATNLGIDCSNDKLILIKDNSIETCEYIVTNLCDGLTKKERQNIFCLIDSWGGFVTTKTLSDALSNSDKKDMTETQKKNKLAKILLNLDMTTFVINHVYDNIGGYGDPLKIPGGKSIVFVSENVILGKSKAKMKDKDEQVGIKIKAKTYKSRWGKENSELEYRINFDGGLDLFFGLLPDAIDGKYVNKPKNGQYIRTHIEDDKVWREKELYCSDFWMPIFKETDFKDYLENKYSFKGCSYDVNEQDDIDLSSEIKDNIED